MKFSILQIFKMQKQKPRKFRGSCFCFQLAYQPILAEKVMVRLLLEVTSGLPKPA